MVSEQTSNVVLTKSSDELGLNDSLLFIRIRGKHKAPGAGFEPTRPENRPRASMSPLFRANSRLTLQLLPRKGRNRIRAIVHSAFGRSSLLLTFLAKERENPGNLIPGTRIQFSLLPFLLKTIVREAGFGQTGQGYMSSFAILIFASHLTPETGEEGYRFLEHMTDAEIESYGSTLEEAFENAGIALEDTMVDIKTISPKIDDNIKVDGADKEELLYDWLEALIVKQDTQSMVYSKFKCKISKEKNGRIILDANVSGERFDPTKHEQKTAIKAPTYHDMKIKETKKDGRRRVTLRFLLDL